MADSMEVENASFWLPTHILADDDFFTTDRTSMKDFPNHSNFDFLPKSDFGFGSDPFDSLQVSSTGDAFLLSHLTRKLAQASISEKQWGISTSPQSTLTGLGRSGLTSPVGTGPSPPLTPDLKNEVGWDLLYEAAGQVARLKMNSIVSQMNNNHNRCLISTPSHINNNQEVKWAQNGNCNCRHHYNHQTRRSYGGGVRVPEAGWGNCGPQERRMDIGGVKRQSVGTGVFLPRTVSNSPPRHHHRHHHNHNHHQLLRSEPGRKPIVGLPTRATQPINMELEEANRNSQSRFRGAGFPTDHEIMLARRNVILEQQRRNMTRIDNNKAAAVSPGHELRLPNDWTY